MKPSVAVALIVAGTILLVTPYISNGFGTAQVTSVITELQRNVDMRGNMPSWYDTGCFVAGILMVSIGAITSLRQQAV